MSSQLFYRAYSPKRAGQKPTALVSVTSSIIRAANIAFHKEYKDDEDPAEIWIAMIKVPDRDKDIFHSAQEMAKRRREQKSVLFKNEYLFEWEIPTEYVVHRVSAQTLLERGLDVEEYCEKIWDEFVRKGIDVYNDHTRYEEELEMFMEIEADAIRIGL
ncbi:uncharacterized protein EAE97_007886 [Botrytis byssoidea]|uniref:DUF7587 domain-containing protein n=1 Tax=Botrytis byssoidea TaxID=139641 RepID=A0A9P5M216_9HELO|nr:uncharacterized protein EAE97_007886 [Botrytis byssoidea]KAF7936520.1 hypothetical protein EAE97_007886 [Botrytis byssoidea]